MCGALAGASITLSAGLAAAQSARPDTLRRNRAEIGAFYHQLDNSYPDWRGVNVRVQHNSPRVSPFAFFSTQSREAGSQQNYGAGSYIVFGPHAYMIASVSGAPGTDPVIFPRLRGDLLGLVDFLPVRGLVIMAGLTEIRFAGPARGRIVSAGSMYYRGHAILNGVIRFNTDKNSGARSRSTTLGGQYGTEGRTWVGGEVTTGNEAYRVFSESPFDARFSGTSASAFVQKWVTRGHGVTARYDFENKHRAYHRNGLTLSYFVEF